MLANVLAVLLGLGSLVFYLTAFFYPEVHRRSDFLWSGLGLFYAVVLWFCAGQMTGAVLLGQMTAVSLLLGLGWQTLTVRREKTPVYQQTPVVLTPERVGNWAKGKLNQLRIAPAATIPVQLEKRQLGDRSDPRRRPLYDYEFVEDGVDDVEPASPPAETVEASTQSPLAATEPAPVTDAAPPSAEAEILLIEEPAPDPLSLNSLEDKPASLMQLATAEGDEAATDTSSNQSSVGKTPSDELELTDTSPSTDEWDEDWEGVLDESEALDVKAAASRSPLSKSPQRPGLLATPLILIGWVKDLIGSLARPKPSKPVIDIPRRDVSSRVDSDRINPKPHSTQPLSEQIESDSFQDERVNTPLESVQADPDPEGWEESNWDD